MKYLFSRKIFLIMLIGIVAFSSYKVIAFFSNDEMNHDFKGAVKTISVKDNGLNFESVTTAKTVSELIQEKEIELGEHDKIIPDLETKIHTGTKIEIQRAAKIKILVDGKKIDKYVLGKTVKEALLESQIELSRLDKTSPKPESIVFDELSIVVTRINIERVTEKESIDFKVIAKTDSKMNWREKEIETKGEEGMKEVKYEITYKNGKEISRVILTSEITQKPKEQVEIQGTYIKLGKTQRGQGTWYAQPNYLKQKFAPIVNDFAASTTIPKGNYAKVTNTASGKSVVVQINDYGPQGKGRIIDLDKIAFQKIASLGAGVIGVRVEEILN